MASPLIFHYKPGQDPVRRMPTLIKLPLAVAFAVWASLCPEWGLFPAFLAILYAAKIARISWISFLRLLPPLLFLFLVTGILPLLQAHNFLDVLADGLLRTFRFGLLLAAGHILTTTTNPATLAATLEKLLTWTGPQASRTLATMASLALTAVPGILDRASALREAALLRGWNSAKKPWILAKIWTLPLLRVLLERGVWTAWSLELRGWRSLKK
ncbi:MAG: energy-coupling factor transporter transmembrane protein EcfT [Spirochaetales bacterium]|nr:energy-coupling factor transporter transmembrane protein EcfT [Spirochaetales bacterium]